MKSWSIGVVVLTATALSGTAFAGAAAKDARTLVLRKSDFPARTLAFNREGNRQGYGVTFRYRVGGRSNDLSTGAVVLPSRSAASAAYREYVSDIGKKAPTLALPKFGDEQRVSFLLGTAELYVRKNTVFWTITLARTGSTGSNANEIRRAEATAELKKYAAIQARRVGRG
jgi:hypothetical protein